ncbi:MAG: DUF1491 family protein [Parvibaculaceae bacterium]|nr:DUF1491 family protein [Parvibaculaceae bacterium]
MVIRLTSDIFVHALIRRAELNGAAAMVVCRGDATGGGIFVKLNTLDGMAIVFSQSRTLDGEPMWVRGTGPEPVSDEKAEAYLTRQRGFDPDIWIVEIEDRQGRHFLLEPVA